MKTALIIIVFAVAAIAFFYAFNQDAPIPEGRMVAPSDDLNLKSWGGYIFSGANTICGFYMMYQKIRLSNHELKIAEGKSQRKSRKPVKRKISK